MVMLTYIARTGQEILVASESDCADAIRAGELHRGSLVMDGRTGRWMKAGEYGEIVGLLDSVRVTGLARAASRPLRAVAVTAWLVALIGPPALAWGVGVDPMLIVPQSVTCTVVLAIVAAVAGLLIRSARRRWRLGLTLAIVAFVAGLALLAESTGALGAGLVPAVTRLFAPGAK